MKELRPIIHDVPIDYFVSSETKLDNSFANAQLTVNNYEIREGRIETKKGWFNLICKKRSYMQKTKKI